jgi:hypothetical protein
MRIAMISSQRTARRLGLAATILLGLAAGSLARADNIPASALEADQKSCIAACVGRGKPAEKCTAACSCSAKAYGEQLTFEEYLAVSNAVKDGKEPPKVALDKMSAIGKTCSAELK